MREAGVKAEGIIVDLHVVRVAPRLGIASGTDPKKLEKQMMELLLPEQWGEAGMAISFLGREICRPSNPKCPECLMKKVCDFYREAGHQEGCKKNKEAEVTPTMLIIELPDDGMQVGQGVPRIFNRRAHRGNTRREPQKNTELRFIHSSFLIH